MAFLLGLTLIVGGVPGDGPSARAAAVPGPAAVATGSAAAAATPAIQAASAVLISVGSSRILFDKDGSSRRAPASTTKIMTALVVAERAGLDEVVAVSERAAATAGSSMWLAAGENLTVREALYGLLLPSGNDAAVALAEHVAGSVEEFAVLMNDRARSLGAMDTHFRNPHGLDEPGHYTTAHDLATIAAKALQDPVVAEIVATKLIEVGWPGHEVDRALRNRNRLLWEYEGADGVKTGFTDQAGKCLVASAARGGLHLLAVVMDSPDIWGEATALLDYGFSTFSPHVVVRRGEAVRTVRVVGGDRERLSLVAADDLIVPVAPGEAERIELTREGETEVKAPVEAGRALGRLRVLLGGAEIAATPLVGADEVKAQTVFRAFLDKLWSLLRTVARGLTGTRRR